MDYAHLDAATLKQTMSCCLRGADQNDQRQREDGNPRRCASQIMKHRTGPKIFWKMIFAAFVKHSVKRAANNKSLLAEGGKVREAVF